MFVACCTVCLALLFIAGHSSVIARSVTAMVPADSPIIDAAHLQQLIKEKKVKVVDAAFSVDPKPDWKKFKEEYYGNFDKLIKDFVREPYVKEHIHGAVHFNLDIGLYPGEFQRFALYPPEIFQNYVRKLGINNGDHVVVYSRGAMSGMLFAARVWWLLKYYGLEKVQVLNGGLDAWKKAGNPVDGEVVVVPEGNFEAKVNPKLLITFEELEEKDSDGKALFDKFDTINVYDGRPRGQYTGETPQNLTSSGPVPGFHIKGSRSLPAAELVDINGLKSKEELQKLLNKAGYTEGKQTITYCALGMQGSLLSLALETLGIKDVQLYNGSLTELALRDPARISGK